MFKKTGSMILCFAFLFSSISAKELIPGGESIGIQVAYDGVLISGTYTFEANGRKIDPSTAVHSSDLITHVNGVRIHTLKDLSDQLSQYQDALNQIDLTIQRNGQILHVMLTTAYTTGGMKSGLYVKDKITGVGTVSYYDPDTGIYGALGHEIMDSDTNQIADVHEGSIYPANVDAIQKAKKNVPGEKQATIDFSKTIGTVEKNSVLGIYGMFDLLPNNKAAMETADHRDVHTGAAMIMTVLHGQEVKLYQINITKVHTQNSKDVKGIELTIDDAALKQETNGIIQGMSGSPIIQDGKIVGALTHVITSDPMKGYGVFIDWMLNESAS